MDAVKPKNSAACTAADTSTVRVAPPAGFAQDATHAETPGECIARIKLAIDAVSADVGVLKVLIDAVDRLEGVQQKQKDTEKHKALKGIRDVLHKAPLYDTPDDSFQLPDLGRKCTEGFDAQNVQTQIESYLVAIAKGVAIKYEDLQDTVTVLGGIKGLKGELQKYQKGLEDQAHEMRREAEQQDTQPQQDANLDTKECAADDSGMPKKKKPSKSDKRLKQQEREAERTRIAEHAKRFWNIEPRYLGNLEPDVAGAWIQLCSDALPSSLTSTDNISGHISNLLTKIRALIARKSSITPNSMNAALYRVVFFDFIRTVSNARIRPNMTREEVNALIQNNPKKSGLEDLDNIILWAVLSVFGATRLHELNVNELDRAVMQKLLEDTKVRAFDHKSFQQLATDLEKGNGINEDKVIKLWTNGSTTCYAKDLLLFLHDADPAVPRYVFASVETLASPIERAIFQATEHQVYSPFPIVMWSTYCLFLKHISRDAFCTLDHLYIPRVHSRKDNVIAEMTSD
jgi:hypothetical protein